jgi:CHAT domain-containing protein
MRVPSTHAQQTSEQAHQLLAQSVEQNKTDHEQALQTATQALEIFSGLNDQPGMIQAKMRMAQYNLALGNLTDAKTLYEEIRQYWHAQQDPVEEAATLLDLNLVEQREGDWFNALQYLALAQPLIASHPDLFNQARFAASSAWVYNFNGLHDTARAEYENARAYFGQIPDARAVNRMTLLIGYTYVLQQNYNAAAPYLNAALANFSIPVDLANCHEYLGLMYIGLQDFTTALQHLQTALASYEAAHNVMEAARVEALIGQINEQQGALASARTRYSHALQTFQKVQDRVNESAVYFSLGKLELKARDYNRAETYLKRSLETTEDLRRASIAHDLTTAYSATVYERYQTYIDCLVRQHKLHPAQQLHIEAFKTSELARSRALGELLRDSQTLPKGPHQGLALKERALRQTIGERASSRIKLLAEPEPAKPEEVEKRNARLSRLETEVNQLRREHAEVAEKLRQVDPLFDRIQQPTAYSLEQIQREVIDDEQTLLLEFMLGDEASYAWAIRKNDIKFYELPNRATINKAAKELYDLVAEEPKGDMDQRVKAATTQLGKLVIDPLKQELNPANVRRVIIVADGGLHYVPLQLLPAPGNQNEPLIANFEIVNAPSASILGQLRKEKRQRQPTKRLLAAFGDPVFRENYAAVKGDSGAVLASVQLDTWQRAWRDIEIAGDKVDPSVLKPLTFSKFELQKLRELGGAESFIARGFAASRETLTTLDLSQYSVLHVATHGVFDPKNPEITGFFLSMLDESGRQQNGFITTPDIYALHAPVDLVVLSACRTGLGKGVRGEGLIGLTSGFMHAGASSVAATLWKVDDNATSHLMDYFYTNMLQKNMPPAEALRAAQNTLRQDPRWQSPHYWAAFTLQGEYQNTIRIPPPTGASRTVKNAVGATLIALLLLGIGWGFWRRRGPRPAVNN